MEPPPPGGSAPARLLIHAYTHDDVLGLELRNGSEIRIGRSRQADLCLPDRTVSMDHASLRFEAGRIEVTDRGSLTGTFVRGGRVARAQLARNEVFAVGAVSVSVHVRRPDESWAPLCGQDSLLERLTEEVERSAGGGEPFCVVALFCARQADSQARHVSRWLPALRSRARSFDHLAAFGPHGALCLLPCRGPEEANATVEDWLQACGGQALRAGIVSGSEPPTDADTLVRAAYGAARTATAAAPIERAGLGIAAVSEVSTPFRSKSMRRLRDVVERSGREPAPALVLGEPGTGRRVVARALHRASGRPIHALRFVDCAVDGRIEQLFGRSSPEVGGGESEGLLCDCDGGTVVLENLHRLDGAAQAALLHMLVSGRARALDSTVERELDVRVIGLADASLEEHCARGDFRSDLLHRLSTLALRVPPLRERREDIEDLSRRFLSDSVSRWDTASNDIAAATLECLWGHDWPGNVRELRNVIERASVLSVGRTLTPDDLPSALRCPSKDMGEADQGAPAALQLSDEGKSFKQRVRNYESQLIIEALALAGGNQSRAASALQIPLRTLVHKLKAYGLRGEPAGD